jgi:Peptidase family M28
MRYPAFLSAIPFTLALQAQDRASAADAAATITPDDVRRRIEIVADDSMLGRDTPGPGLERAAGYVIREFRRLGLQPGAGEGYEQRFGVSRWTVDPARSGVEFFTDSSRARVVIGREARFISGAVSGREISGDAILLGGPVTAEAAASSKVRDRVVLLAVDYLRPLPEELSERINQLGATARAVVILSNRDSTTFAQRLRSAAEPRLTPDIREPGAPVVEVHERTLRRVLRDAGIDLARWREQQRAEFAEAPRLRVSLRLTRDYLMKATAPNLVAVLEGSDPLLRQEYVVISAHLDHLGVRTGQADSIYNGADDNASGVAGLLELAEAFSRPGARPKRSLLFLLPSGEEEGLWGSAYFTEHPTVPLSAVAANLNMDLIGRNWPDSVIASGLEHSSLGPTLQRVARAHPELRMAPVADRWPEERIFYRSDHYYFARKGIPFLFFTSGTHPDYHQPTDTADRIDAEKLSRLARLIFYVGMTVADDPKRPRWRPESYQLIVETD